MDSDFSDDLRHHAAQLRDLRRDPQIPAHAHTSLLVAAEWLESAAASLERPLSDPTEGAP